ncbi:MAG: HAMP domain-containing histidine kinase [Actinobacteria bacterium]|nr:HAMP domain-containing histidine kinase [Actinomycetota bacterium]
MRWRPLTLVVVVTAVGAAGTIAVAAAMGMPPRDVAHIALFLVPAAVVTVASAAFAGPLLARSPTRHRLVAIGLLGTVVALTNLVVLTRFTFVNDHDASVVGALLAYAAGAGVAAALAVARTSAVAIERLGGTAARLGAGDLDARVGPLDADAELATLARTLDDMAGRLQASLARERELEARRRDLITAASHDLRTPLSSLRAMVDAIADGVVDDPPSLRRYITHMRTSVESLVALVDDLFELAQLDAGVIERETERVLLRDVVRDAVAACEPHVADKAINLTEQLNGHDELLCSPYLARVLQNLLTNAIRHTPTDGAVRVYADTSDVGLQLVVEDTGEGIEEGSLGQVFEPFWRADPARSSDGAGLGLTLAKRIVESLGGRIDAASEPGVGSRFAVVVPAIGEARPVTSGDPTSS